jgi:septal ring factor EnvC (AmiA/AmiB activator)
MAEVLKAGGAIDARFQAVDERFHSVNKDIGRLEGKVNTLEQNQGLHHDGLTKHDYAIDKLTTALEGFKNTILEVNETIKEWGEMKQQVKGGIKLFKFVLAPIGGAAGLVYIVKSLWNM